MRHEALSKQIKAITINKIHKSKIKSICNIKFETVFMQHVDINKKNIYTNIILEHMQNRER